MNKKISELTKATEVKNEDIMMILQDNENKQVEVKNIFNHRYKLEVTENSELGQEIDIPCYYKVGKEVLDVYLNGERLLKSTDNVGTDGHYLEVGDIESISNKIKTTTDWNLEKGDVLDLVVRGEYNAT